MMHLPTRFSLFSAVLAIGLPAVAPFAHGQVQPAVQSTSSQTTGNGTYIAVDPLANIRYDNRYDISVGMAYAHMKAGPNLLSGIESWRSRRVRLLLAEQALGTGRIWTRVSRHQRRGAQSVLDPGSVRCGVLLYGGAEWLGPHNKHGALIAHFLAGGAYGSFEQNLRGHSPADVGFYNSQVAPAFVIGGHIDLNRSPRWVFRITPDANITRYGINYGRPHHPDRCEFRHLGRRSIPIPKETLIADIDLVAGVQEKGRNRTAIFPARCRCYGM